MSDRRLFNSFKFVEELRTIDSEMPLQTAAAFLLVAMFPNITMKEMTERLGTSQASVSRNVAALSKIQRQDKPGHDLVFAEEDPAERRRKIVRLTRKGELLAERLKQYFPAT